MTPSLLDVSVTRVVAFEGAGSVKAFCDLTIGEQVLIRGVRVVHGKRGLFISMPRQQGKHGAWYDSVSVLTKDLKAAVDRAVLAAYEQQLATPAAACNAGATGVA